MTSPKSNNPTLGDFISSVYPDMSQKGKFQIAKASAEYVLMAHLIESWDRPNSLTWNGSEYSDVCFRNCLSCGKDLRANYKSGEWEKYGNRLGDTTYWCSKCHQYFDNLRLFNESDAEQLMFCLRTDSLKRYHKKDNIDQNYSVKRRILKICQDETGQHLVDQSE